MFGPDEKAPSAPNEANIYHTCTTEEAQRRHTKDTLYDGSRAVFSQRPRCVDIVLILQTKMAKHAWHSLSASQLPQKVPARYNEPI